jgi:replicative DNA helicase
MDEYVDVPEEDKQGIAYVQYAKNRHGPAALAKLAFMKDRVMFGELQRDPLGRVIK